MSSALISGPSSTVSVAGSSSGATSRRLQPKAGTSSTTTSRSIGAACVIAWKRVGVLRRHCPCRYAVDGKAGADDPGEQQRVEGWHVSGLAYRRKAVEGDAHDVGARVRGRVENRNVEPLRPRREPLGAETSK